MRHSNRVVQYIIMLFCVYCYGAAAAAFVVVVDVDTLSDKSKKNAMAQLICFPSRLHFYWATFTRKKK